MAEERVIDIQTSRGSADFLEIVSRINDMPSAQVRYHMPEDSTAIAAIADDAVSAAAEDQSAMFQPRLAPDETIIASDGKGGSLTFNGFGTNPSHQIGIGGVGSSITLLHESAIICAYDPSIYHIRTPPKAKGRLSTTDKSVTNRLQFILDETVKLWQDADSRVRGTDENEALKDTIHVQNSAIKDRVDALLGNSMTEVDGLDRLSKFSNVNKSINFQLWKGLFSRRTDFFDTLRAIMAQWQFYYAPSKQPGEMGEIRQLAEVIEDGEGKEIVCTDIRIAAGPVGIMPVTQVLVEGIINQAPRSKDQMDNGARQGEVADHIAAFPPEFTGGRLMRTGMPPFLGMPFRGVQPGTGGDLSVDGYIAARDGYVTDLTDFVEKQVTKFAEGWAKNTYVDAVLSPCTAELTCELDFSWEAGRVYNVSASKADGSGVLFTGLLNAERHTIESKQDGAYCRTTLSFSHVRVNGAELPI